MPVLVSHLLCRILLGARAVLLEKFDVAAVLEAAERFGVTDLPLIGGMVFDVVSLGRRAGRASRRTVRKVSVGGAPTPMASKRALRGLFDGAEIIEAYGQTESTDGVLMARGTERVRPRGHRRPDEPVRARRDPPRRRRRSPAPDEEGEIVVGGPTVMRGLPPRSRRDGRGGPRRLAAHRRSRPARRRRLLLHHRPREGPDHHRRRERVAGRGRGGAARASRRRRRRGHRHAASALGRAGDGGRRARATAPRSTARRSVRSPARGSRASSGRAASSSWRRCRATPTTRCRRICCARELGGT